jgi:hypothetical protein
MPTSLLCLAVLLLACTSAVGNDLEALDRVGRDIAVLPCAKPRATTKVERNIHDESVQDRFITLRCKGATSEVVRSSTNEYKHASPLLASTRVADPRLPPPFQVGASLVNLRSRLGKPESEKPDSVTYLLPSETREERVTFFHNGTSVTKVLWSWYFD